MDYVVVIMTIAFAQVLATLTPWPNFFISVKQGLSCSRMTGFVTSSWVWSNATMSGAPATFEVDDEGVHTVNV